MRRWDGAIEHCVPAGETFGQIHDAKVDEILSKNVPDWKANIPTMPEAYWQAAKKEGNSMQKLQNNLMNFLIGQFQIRGDKMKKFPGLLLFITLGALVACQVRFEDVSKYPEFRHVIGSRYEVVGAVNAYGIRPHSKAEVEYITLIPPPGFDGSEIGFRVPINYGSKITVLKVLKSNRWPDPNITFVVKIEGTEMPIDSTIRIDLFRGNEGKGSLQLNPEVYQNIYSERRSGQTPS